MGDTHGLLCVITQQAEAQQLVPMADHIQLGGHLVREVTMPMLEEHSEEEVLGQPLHVRQLKVLGIEVAVRRRLANQLQDGWHVAASGRFDARWPHLSPKGIGLAMGLLLA
jgi:hypothetical protein